MIRLKIHSVVDVITNSSTTIYSYYDGCVNPAKEMVNEFLKTMDSPLSFDDMFFIELFASDIYIYYEGGEHYIWENDGDDDPFKGIDDHRKFLETLMDDIIEGKVVKPQWMVDCECYENDMGYTPDTVICIKEKDPKYKNLGKLIKKFVESVDADGYYNG